MAPGIDLSTMRDAVALWNVDQGSAADVVRAACDLLVAGLDGPALCTLAAVSIHHAGRTCHDCSKRRWRTWASSTTRKARRRPAKPC